MILRSRAWILVLDASIWIQHVIGDPYWLQRRNIGFALWIAERCKR